MDRLKIVARDINERGQSMATADAIIASLKASRDDLHTDLEALIADWVRRSVSNTTTAEVFAKDDGFLVRVTLPEDLQDRLIEETSEPFMNKVFSEMPRRSMGDVVISVWLENYRDTDNAGNRTISYEIVYFCKNDQILRDHLVSVQILNDRVSHNLALAFNEIVRLRANARRLSDAQMEGMDISGRYFRDDIQR